MILQIFRKVSLTFRDLDFRDVGAQPRMLAYDETQPALALAVLVEFFSIRWWPGSNRSP